MMRSLFDALLLKGLWKFKPIHVLAFWLFMAYQGWMASPYFMYYVVGAPEPGTAPRYVGTLRIEGDLQFSRRGAVPARYFIVTEKGETEFHCGFLPHKRSCFLHAKNFDGLTPFEAGFDPYWGLDFMKYPPPYAHFNKDYEPKRVQYGRELHMRGYALSTEEEAKKFQEKRKALSSPWDITGDRVEVPKTLGQSKHNSALLWLIFSGAVYSILSFISFFVNGKRRSKQPDDTPSEAEIAERLKLEASEQLAAPRNASKK